MNEKCNKLVLKPDHHFSQFKMAARATPKYYISCMAQYIQMGIKNRKDYNVAMSICTLTHTHTDTPIHATNPRKPTEFCVLSTVRRFIVI